MLWLILSLATLITVVVWCATTLVDEIDDCYRDIERLTK